MSLLSFKITIALVLLLSFQSTVKTVTEQDAILKSVVMVHRHGDRNPISVGDKDPHRDPSEWPEGLGQLTKAGKLRMYYVGLHVKGRYKNKLNFLTDKIDEIHSVSCDIDRCIASAELVLSGLYRPDNANSKWHPKINWQPVPVHSVPAKYDALLETKAACPKITSLYEVIQQSDQVKIIYQKLRTLLDLIERDLGLHADKFEQISWFNSDLKCQKEKGKALPDWYDATNIKLLEDSAVEVFSLYTSTHLLKKLQSGPLLREIYMRLNNSELVDNDGVLHDKKFIQYSTHDTEIVNLMNTLGIWDRKLLPYGISLFFELYQSSNDNSEYVKLLKLTDMSQGYNEVPLDCGQAKGKPCSFEQFKTMIDQFQLSNWAVTCNE